MVLTNIERLLEERIPSAARAKLRLLLDYAGEPEKEEKWLVRNAMLGLVVSLGLTMSPLLVKGLFLPYVKESAFPLLMASLFVASMVMFGFAAYFSLYFRIDYRKKRTFEVLPDFLTAVSMNINAGMEPMSALYISLRPDFEPITSEMRKVRSLALGSRSVFDQLAMLKKGIDSNPLRRALAVVDRASRSGGDLGRLLLSVADDLREMNKLQKELETATRGYAYFIGFLVVFGVPMLLGVSSVFIQLTSKQMMSSDFSSVNSALGGIPIGFGASTSQLDSGSVDLVFMMLLAVSSLSAGLMFGVLWQGEIRYGVRYLPLLLPVSIVMFVIVRSVVASAMMSFGV
ncbi:Type II secretion system (T2SS), protein F [uncultured archaeon]|nr:Type II secretion system (T2SS), protein F [uncultured archaeon]